MAGRHKKAIIMARTQRKWKTMKPGAYVSHDSLV